MLKKVLLLRPTITGWLAALAGCDWPGASASRCSQLVRAPPQPCLLEEFGQALGNR